LITPDLVALQVKHAVRQAKPSRRMARGFN
jgi:hypothetical protein